MDLELHDLLMDLSNVFMQMERLNADDAREVKVIKRKAAQRSQLIQDYMRRASVKGVSDVEPS